MMVPYKHVKAINDGDTKARFNNTFDKYTIVREQGYSNYIPYLIHESAIVRLSTLKLN